jgi:hypothetical protein
MESFEKRLKRYTSQDDLEIFGWMTVMMHNVTMRELRIAKENNLYQCLFLSSHAVIQTISENMFNKRGIEGTRFYLESFFDGTTRDRQYSLISDYIHDMRNVIAHQGYSSLQHAVDFNDEMTDGWKEESGIIYINTNIYAEQFVKAFEQGAHVQKYRQLSDEERVKRKYNFIRKWLRVDKAHPITREIKKLDACNTLSDIRTQEVIIQQTIYNEYGLN